MIQWNCSRTIILVVHLMMFAAFAQSNTLNFTLQHQRDQGSNIITLYCRNVDGLNESRAMFFLNNSLLSPENYSGFFDLSNKNGVVIFQIKQHLEGRYSCGIGDLRSLEVQFIAYPTQDFQRGQIKFNKRKNYAVTGGTAVLECLISPGALIHQYYVTWKNGNLTLFSQSTPLVRSFTQPEFTDSRYRLDPMNLSLIIEDVQMRDSFDSYYCVLHVQDPTTMTTYTYRNTQYLNISLIVLSPPVIIANPQTSTISQGDNAIFICEARGYPLPTITWQHNDETVPDNQSDYLITQSNDGSMTTTSNLRVFNAHIRKSGQVTCIASASAPTDSGLTLASDDRTTSLIVLGAFKKFDVFISTRGDAIFFFDLPTIYNESVHLFIKYINVYNSSLSYNRTSSIGFVNTLSIQHVEYSSQVYYDRFRVKVGIVSGGIHGPLSASPGVYDKDRSTFCNCTIDKFLVLMSSIVPAGCLLLLNIGLLCVISLLICVSKGQITKQELEGMTKSIIKGTSEKDELNSSEPRNGPTNRQGSQTESNGPGIEEPDSANSSARKKDKKHRNHPSYSMLKESIDGVFTGKKYSFMKRIVRKYCKECLPKQD